jgi:Domain of unknown function (DUF5666)
MTDPFVPPTPQDSQPGSTPPPGLSSSPLPGSGYGVPTAAVSGTIRARQRSRLPAVAAGIVAALVIAGVGFAGGYEVGTGAAPTASPLGFTRTGNGANPFASGGIGAGRGGFFRGAGGGTTAGTISSVAPDQLTVQLAAGGSKLVLVTSSTTVTKVTSTTQAITDLTNGETVTVTGTTNPDGSVTADRIIVGDVGGLFTRTAPGASASPGN